MNEKVSGPSDATLESDAESTATEQSQPQSSTLVNELLRAAAEDGHDIGGLQVPEAPEPTVPVAESVEQPESETESVKEPTETEETPAEGIDTATESETEPASIDEQIAAHKARGEKPPWYLVRISEETAKRKERTERAERAEARAQEAEIKAQQLESQLASATAPMPTEANPFSDVYDNAQLKKLEDNYEKILEFAETARFVTELDEDGTERRVVKNVLIGKDKDGSEIRKDMPESQIAEMRYKADRALRKDIPARRGYLDARAKADAQAVEIYPELKDRNADLTREVVAILQNNRQLETVLGPEALTWICHAIEGRKQYLARNGNSATPSDVARRIETASKARIAPTTMKPRSSIERKGADLAALNKKFEQSGDPDTAADLVAAQLSKNRGGTAKRMQPIAE